MLSNKVCLVTGGCGFIGHHMVKKLVSLGNTVHVLDNLSNASQENYGHFLHKVDISDFESLSEVFSKIGNIDLVFHFAALARVQPSIKNPIDYNKTNVNGTINLLELSKRYNVNRFIFSSSSSVYGNSQTPFSESMINLTQLSPYALQKYMGEQYCRLYSELYGLNTVCLRYFNVYGPEMPLSGQYKTALSIFKEKKINNLPLPITNDGRQTRDFTHVDDVVSANLLVSQIKQKHETFNVGNGKKYSINYIADLIGGDKEYIGHVVEPFETLSDSNKLMEMTGWEPNGNLESFIKNFF
jgi:UDP-glucose 4-epimerase